jgi:hypothetical protein
MMARIGILKALHRGVAREFNSDRKETRWGQTEVEAGSMRPVLTRAIMGDFHRRGRSCDPRIREGGILLVLIFIVGLADQEKAWVRETAGRYVFVHRRQAKVNTAIADIAKNRLRKIHVEKSPQKSPPVAGKVKKPFRRKAC